MEEKWKIDFWSIFFSVLSLILFELALFIPAEGKLILLTFSIVSIIFAVILYYIRKINFSYKMLIKLDEDNESIKKDFSERFNYLKDLQDLKVDVKMLKNKRGEIEFIDIVKIAVAAILIYVIIVSIKTIISS